MSAFNVRGEQGAREILVRWKDKSVAQNVYVIFGDNKIFSTALISTRLIEAARFYSIIPIPSWRISIRPLGRKYLFFIRSRTTRKFSVRPARCLFPACNWRRFGIIHYSDLYHFGGACCIRINSITKPIRILDRGMSRLASGRFATRISQQNGRPRRQAFNLALQFDKMAQQLRKLVERATCCTMCRTKCARPWRACRRLWN